MAIDLLYVPLFTIEEVILDKDTGLPLAGGVVSFFRDSQRATPKSVFQISGSSPNYTFTDVGSVLTLGISGTFVDGSGDPFVPYAYPYDAAGNVDLYFVTVESAGAIDQFTREAVPHLAGTNIPSNQRSSTENELSNPQFVEYFLNDPGTNTISVTGSNTVTEIAPDWDLISSGTGTITFQRLQPTASNIPTNPAYILTIAASAGLGSEVTLRQRLTHTPSIMRGGFASGSLIAAVLSGGGSNISMSYAPSTGTATTIIPSTSIIADGSYHSIANNAAIPQQVNDPAATGYIDILITIPTSRTIGISSIQLVGTEVSLDIPYDEQTVGRQKDHLFHYYEDGLIFKPIPSYLVGWNFPLNPAQLTGRPIVAPTLTGGANRSLYAWDQTILFSAVDNVLSFEEDFGTYGFSVVNTGADTAFAVIQYLDVSVLADILANRISVQLNGYSFNTTDTTLKGTVSLYWTDAASLPNINSGTYLSLVSGVDSDGVPTVANGGPWTGINNERLNTVNMPFRFSNTPSDTVSLSGFEAAGATAVQNATFFAIVVAFAPVPNTGGATLNYVSLVSGDIPSKPGAQTFEEVLKQCEYYLEKSYNNNVTPGTATSGGCTLIRQLSVDHAGPNTVGFVPRVFWLPFKTLKRDVAYVVTIYSIVTGTADTVRVYITNNGVAFHNNDINFSSSWNAANPGQKGIDYVCLNATEQDNTAAGAALVYTDAYLHFQYTIDARLGVV